MHAGFLQKTPGCVTVSGGKSLTYCGMMTGDGVGDPDAGSRGMWRSGLAKVRGIKSEAATSPVLDSKSRSWE